MQQWQLRGVHKILEHEKQTDNWYLLKQEWQPTPVFSPGKSQGQRSLAGYGPRGHKVQLSDWAQLLSDSVEWDN